MDQVVVLNIELTKPHADSLEAKARDVNLPMNAYIQRVLQQVASPQMTMPNPLARQLAACAAAAMNVSREIGEARRAYEAVDGRQPDLGRLLAEAAGKASDILSDIATTQKQMA